MLCRMKLDLGAGVRNQLIVGGTLKEAFTYFSILPKILKPLLCQMRTPPPIKSRVRENDFDPYHLWLDLPVTISAWRAEAVPQ